MSKLYHRLCIITASLCLLSKPCTILATEISENFTYPNQASNAVSLSFDDAWPSQVEVGVPLLNKYQVKGTFYVMPFRVEEKLELWRKAVSQGHEIGNHTNEHLCTGNFAWLREMNKGLEQVDLDYVEQDILKTNDYIKEKLRVQAKSFAYPCGNTFVGRGENVKSYVPLIAKHFTSGRTWLDETGNHPTYTDFAQLTSIRMDGISFDELKPVLEQLRHNHSWIILAGHNVGEKGLYTVDQKMLEQLIEYLKDPKNGFWLDTVSNVGDYIRKQRNK
ncbi:polysaccharide deacetylase family protein [Pseudoalteromonas sp. T1lg65]|uniref:polysaccharide deacetylase family protein n=1 Tax=Pseudoalteromonas sp. T1lg65 TaxID=2077101 RepID=UPI003F78E5F4